MNNLSLRMISVIIFLLLIIFASVLGYSTFRLSQKFSQIQSSWISFDSQNNEKARLLSSIYEVLGYGGMIHNFKNYILRKDYNTFIKTERSMGVAQGVVNQYLALSSSPTEKLALNDIQSMLEKYQKSLAFIHEETEDGSSSSSIDALVTIDDTLALRGLHILSEEIRSQYSYFKDETNKPVLVKAIREELGYGGMIHAFKNYILRNDEKYQAQFSISIDKISKLVKAYLRLESTAGEKTALEDILNTLEKYNDNIEMIDEGIKKGLSPEEIDAQVKLDDTYALRGLQTLDQDIILQIDMKSQELASQLKAVSYQSHTDAIVVIVSTLLLAISIFLIFNSKIINPVRKMSELMLAMASGDLDIFTDDVSAKARYGDTELGKMKASLSIFKEHELERRESEIEIKKLALTDSLTELANRYQFERRYAEMLALANRQEKNITILAIDLDDFKPINDEYGHAAGDLILKSVAKKMLQTFRETDLIARIGGDEFSVIMYGTEGIAGVVKTVERLLAKVPLPVTFGKDNLSVGLSIGIVQHLHGNEDELGVLMEKADRALYEAKNNGKNTYSVYSHSKTEQSLV